MKLQFSLMDRVVGLFIILSCLAFISALVMVGRVQNWFQKYNEYYALYDEGYDLQPGVKVKFLRTQIGQVTDVDLTSGNKVRVRMRILNKYRHYIVADCTAAIVSPTLIGIGSEYIDIIPGGEDGEKIKPGGEIPSRELKKIEKVIFEWLDKFDVEYKMHLMNNIMGNIEYITEQMMDPEGGLFGTLSHLESLSGAVAEGRGSIGKLVQGEELFQKVVKQVERVDRIMASIESAAESIRKGAASVERGAKSTREVTAGLENQMPELLENMASILDNLNKAGVLLEEAMQDVPEISQETREGMRKANQILESVKKNFLIRGNLPAQTRPEAHGLEIRGD